MGDSNSTINVLVFSDSQKLLDYLAQNPRLSESIDSAMGNCFDNFKTYKYSSYLDFTSSSENGLVDNIIIVDDPQSPNKFIGTAQLQHPSIGQGADNHPYIVNLGVNPEYRNRGIAGYILSSLKNISRKKYQSPLRLSITEKSLDNFYTKHGFTRVQDDSIDNSSHTDSPSRLHPWYYQVVSQKQHQSAGSRRRRRRLRRRKSTRRKKNKKTTYSNKGKNSQQSRHKTKSRC